MKKVQIKYKSNFKSLERLNYILDFLNAHPLNNSELSFSTSSNFDPDLIINYGKTNGNFSIPAQQRFFKNNPIETGEWFANKYSIDNTQVFSVEISKKEIQVFFTNKTFGFDIFETLFFHLSRYEEVFCKAEDKSQAGWLKEEKHFLVRHGLETQPVVDQLAKAFFEILLGKKIYQKSTFDLSHDIDILARFQPFYKWIKSLGATAIYRRGWNQFFQSISHYQMMLGGKASDPYDSFDYLFRSESIWQKKVIYLMAGGNTKYDNHYQLQDKRLDEIIYAALAKGYSVGIHPSYNAGFEAERYASEKQALEEKINQPIILNRQHWLRFDWNITPYILEAYGIQEDASMGYNRYLGFRCGTGFPYFLYDFKNEKAFSWKEQPLVFMESSALHQSKAFGEDLKELMSHFINKNKNNSHLSFNFHNSNFDPLLETGIILSDFYKNEIIPLLGKS